MSDLNINIQSDPILGYIQIGIEWWLRGGIPAANCIAAYQPINAASLAASYVNLANPGTNDAAPGVAPGWNKTDGWTFNGLTQYLTTGIIPASGYSMIIRFSQTEYILNADLAGEWKGSDLDFGIDVNRDDAVIKYRVKNICGFNYRMVPAILLVKNLIMDGKLGRIFHFRAKYLQEWIADPNFPMIWKLKKEQSGSGALGDLGAHIIDLSRFLCGEVKSVMSVLTTFIKERYNEEIKKIIVEELNWSTMIPIPDEIENESKEKQLEWLFDTVADNIISKLPPQVITEDRIVDIIDRYLMTDTPLTVEKIVVDERRLAKQILEDKGWEVVGKAKVTSFDLIKYKDKNIEFAVKEVK